MGRMENWLIDLTDRGKINADAFQFTAIPHASNDLFTFGFREWVMTFYDQMNN